MVDVISGNNQCAIWHCIKENPGINCNEICEKLGLLNIKIQPVICEMIFRGYLYNIGKKPRKLFVVDTAMPSTILKKRGPRKFEEKSISGITLTKTGLIHRCGSQPSTKSQGGQGIIFNVSGQSCSLGIY